MAERIKKKISVEDVYRFLTFSFLALLVVWRIPFLNKGIDYTDTGFNMTNYRDFFGNLSQNGIGMFFTNLVGAILYDLLPSHQLLVFRILHYLMWSGAFLIIYFTFRRSVPSLYNTVFSALLLLTSSYQKMGEAMFSYYPFSMLLVAIATYLMYTALTKEKGRRLFVSGVVLGLNFGVRLPNLLFFALVAAVFWYYLCKKQIKKGFARSGIMILGEFTGLVLMLALEIAVIGISAVTGSADKYSSLASSSSQDHGIINQLLHIFNQIFYSVINIAFYTGPIVLACLVFVLLYRAVLKKHMNKTLPGLLAYIFVMLASMFWFGLILSTRVTVFTYVHNFGLIALAFAVISVFALMRSYPELSTAALVTVISTGCIIVGTDLGISRFADVLPQLCVALAIGAFYLCPKDFNKKFKVFVGTYFNIICKTVVAVLLGFTTMIAATVMIPTTYNDASFDKLTTSFSKDITALRGMKTSPERAKSINDLYYAMRKENISDKPVAVIGMFPLVYNIVDNDKYFRQPCIDYNSVSLSSLEKQYEANKSDGVYPVIVISRLHMNQNGLSNFCEDESKVELFNKMLKDCEYTIEFSDENFDVYVPVLN